MFPFFAYSSFFAYHITAQVQRHSTPIRAPRILSARQARNLSFLITGQAVFPHPSCRFRNGEEARPVVYPPLSRLAFFVSSRRRCCVIHTSEQRCIDDVLGLRSEDGRIGSADVAHLCSCVSSFHGCFCFGSLGRLGLATLASSCGRGYTESCSDGGSSTYVRLRDHCC